MKKINSEFLIVLNTLIDGTTVFTYEVKTPFFAHFNYGEIVEGDFFITFKFTKSSARTLVDIDIDGYAKTNCDKCVANIEIKLVGTFSYYFRKVAALNDDSKFDDDEFITISENDTELDLAPIIYENIHLLLPIQRIGCEDRNGKIQCDTEVLQKLEHTQQQINNTEELVDPRWQALLKLKNNN